MAEQFTDEQCKRFATLASPLNWIMTADNLHSQAVALYQQRHNSKVTYLRDGVATERWEANRTIFLLGAFALENVIKAYLVFENPLWISRGKLSKQLKSHDLSALALLSTLLPRNARFDEVLAKFKDGIGSWARYPCALTVISTHDEGILKDTVWQDYLKTMQAFGETLLPRLAVGWEGPHGQSFQSESYGLSFCDIVTKVETLKQASTKVTD